VVAARKALADAEIVEKERAASRFGAVIHFVVVPM
jgi:hypothetical protein